MTRIICIDSGNIQHIAMFAYLGQWEGLSKEYAEEHKVGIDTARDIILGKANNREIFLSNPTLTYMRMVIGYLKRLNSTSDDKIIIAQDYGSWRKEIDKNYKAQRKEFREGFAPNTWWTARYEEFNLFYKKLNDAVPWQFIKIYNIEADDIASFVVRNNKESEVILISRDKDWHMLLTFSNVKIFNPQTKKFVEEKNPMKVLIDKIQGDISDNLLEKPKNEKEFEIRKKIVNLLELPEHIDLIIKNEVDRLVPKSLRLEKVPYNSVREQLKLLYYKDENET